MIDDNNYPISALWFYPAAPFEAIYLTDVIMHSLILTFYLYFRAPGNSQISSP